MPATLERPATKLVLSVSRLRPALSVLSRLCARKTSVTILTNVLFHTEGGTVYATACDGEMWLRLPVGESDSPARFAVPCGVLSEMVGLLDKGDEVTLAPVNGNDLVAMEGLRLRLQLLGGDSADFPDVPEVFADCALSLDSESYMAAMSKAARFVSMDTHRQVLTGILHSFDGEALTLVATDTHRIGILKGVPGVGDRATQFVFPARAHSIMALLVATGGISLTVGGGRASIEFGDARIVTQLLAGTYPNWERVLPKEITSPTYSLDPLAFGRTVRRCLVIARDNAYRCRLRLHDGGLTLTGRSEEKGDYEETCLWLTRRMPEGRETHDMEIAFNGKYLLDALAVCGAKIVAEGTEPSRPFLFRSEGGEVVVCVMPMALA